MRAIPVPCVGAPAGLPAAPSDTGARRRGGGVDWPRLLVRSGLALAVVFSAVTVVYTLRGTEYGFDFHGLWRAGAQLLAGRPLYPAATVHALQAQGNALVAPPFLALVAAPFSALGFTAATVLFNAVCLAGLIGGLRMLGVRDRRVLLGAACSFPALSSFMLGQPDGLFVLGGAIAWRHRDHPQGAVAVGVLVAAKLLAWPLIGWLLVTRRFREAAVATATATVLLLGSWALVGFSGLTGYLSLLGADATAFASRSHSLAALALHLGASYGVSELLMLGLAVALTLAILVRGRFTDATWFSAGLLFGLLCSPILWAHYLLVLVLVIAIRDRRLNPLWLLFATAFWLSPVEQASTVQIALVLALAVALVALAVTPRPPQPVG